MKFTNALLPALLLLISLTVAAQKRAEPVSKPKAPDSLKNISLAGLSFRSVGPAITSGRIADVVVNPANHSEYYVAAAAGGVWKTSNAGITFNPVFDGEGLLNWLPGH